MIPAISAGAAEALLRFPELIDVLDQAFRAAGPAPARTAYAAPAGALLVMPAWDEAGHLGVKISTVFAGNGATGLPAVASTYLLLDGRSGAPVLLIDGTMLTHRRTAAASALASRRLSRPDARTLLMVGTGALIPHLIEAHRAARGIERVLIWGRSLEKARALAERLSAGGDAVAAAPDLEAAVAEADIISCATLARAPLIRGAWLRPGQHVDLVGGFQPDMREIDTDGVARATVFADTRAGVMAEAGDLLIPLAENRFSPDAIAADLHDLARGAHPGRRSPGEITLFKSVGAALEDLAAALWLQAHRR